MQFLGIQKVEIAKGIIGGGKAGKHLFELHIFT